MDPCWRHQRRAIRRRWRSRFCPKPRVGYGGPRRSRGAAADRAVEQMPRARSTLAVAGEEHRRSEVSAARLYHPDGVHGRDLHDHRFRHRERGIPGWPPGRSACTWLSAGLRIPHRSIGPMTNRAGPSPRARPLPPPPDRGPLRITIEIFPGFAGGWATAMIPARSWRAKPSGTCRWSGPGTATVARRGR